MIDEFNVGRTFRFADFCKAKALPSIFTHIAGSPHANYCAEQDVPCGEDKDRGIYYWKVTIKPGETFKIRSSFSVEAPETANVEEMLY